MCGSCGQMDTESCHVIRVLTKLIGRKCRTGTTSAGGSNTPDGIGIISVHNVMGAT